MLLPLFLPQLLFLQPINLLATLLTHSGARGSKAQVKNMFSSFYAEYTCPGGLALGSGTRCECVRDPHEPARAVEEDLGVRAVGL